MNEQDIVRELLNNTIKKNGITARHIAKENDINETVLCRFRKGERRLTREDLKILLDYLLKK